MKIRSLLLALLLLGGLASVAHADEDSNKKAAKAHFKQGKSFQAAGQFDQAIVEYEAAYRLVPLADMLFNIAQAYRLKGDRQKAVEYYDKYLQESPQGRGSSEARQHLQEINRQLAEEEAQRAEGNATKPPVVPPPDQAVKPPTEQPPSDLTLSRRRSGGGGGMGTMRIAGVSTAGVGVALIGTGVFFGLQAKSKSDEVSGAEGTWTPGLVDAIHDGKAAERNMYICYGVGAAAVVTGGVLYFLGVPKASEKGVDVDVAPVATQGGAGVAVWGRF